MGDGARDWIGRPWPAVWVEAAHRSGNPIGQFLVSFMLTVLQLGPGLGLIYLGAAYGPSLLALTPFSLDAIGTWLLNTSEILARMIQG